MYFIKGDADQAAQHIARVINQAIGEGKSVLWLVSGGSAIGVAVRARQALVGAEDVTVMQVDERYGPVGHTDSNWRQILGDGFETSGVKCHPILCGKSAKETTRDYIDSLSAALSEADVAIGLFGIGSDGHTAGVLPNSLAVKSASLVALYSAADYKRITITPAAIAKLDLAVAYTAGKEKLPALHDLQRTLPIAQQPAQALKLPKETYIYNEYLEGAI